jgi:hypothetical protein
MAYGALSGSWSYTLSHYLPLSSVGTNSSIPCYLQMSQNDLLQSPFTRHISTSMSLCLATQWNGGRSSISHLANALFFTFHERARRPVSFSKSRSARAINPTPKLSKPVDCYSFFARLLLFHQ